MNEDLIDAAWCCAAVHGRIDVIPLFGSRELQRRGDSAMWILASGTAKQVLLSKRESMFINAALHAGTKCGAVAPFVPVAPDETGWLVANGKQGDELRYRSMEQGSIIWTSDPMSALRFARRVDAELFAEEDEDAWQIIEYAAAPQGDEK